MVHFKRMGESYKLAARSRGVMKSLVSGLPPPLANVVECSGGTGTTMKTPIIIAILSLGLFTAWPTTATTPYTAIIIDSGSPYFIPKSASVSSGAPIRWDNPTATDHTITHLGCLEDGNVCAFDSGIIRPNRSFTHPGLIPGRYPYLCRVHPIMHGIIIVTDVDMFPSQL